MKYQTTLSRIVELQSHTVIRKLTETQEEYEWLEALIEDTKPKTSSLQKKHYLIAAPLRYPLPIPPRFAARFRPPYFKNVFCGTETDQTSYYEYAYHWMLQRVHLKNTSHTPEPRTLFHVKFLDAHCLDLRRHPKMTKIMDRHRYAASHDFVETHPDLTSILYPSCRDPQHGNCLATFSPDTLGNKPTHSTTLHFIYHQKNQECVIENLMNETRVSILWKSVFN